MARKYFGTDGVRGQANKVITPDLALKVGQAAGLVFRRGEHRNRVVIGKDTRLSGYMIETALVAGFTSVGMDVLLLGPMPTPAVAMLTRSMRADLGVMISASHNAFQDNGIKLFDPDGFKLPDETELEIEALIDSNINDKLAAPSSLGRAKRIESVHARYIEFAKRTLPRSLDLDGLRIVIDLKRGEVGDVILNNLYKHTALQSSFGVNNIALVNGRPLVLGLRQLIDEFVKFRIEVIVRKTKFELREARERAHILEGLLKALDAMEEFAFPPAAAEDLKRGVIQPLLKNDLVARALPPTVRRGRSFACADLNNPV